MIKTDISFDKVVKTVEHYTTPYSKGKNKGKYPLEVSESGFTAYANAIKTLTQYCDLGKFTIPSKAEKAEELLKKVEEVYS